MCLSLTALMRRVQSFWLRHVLPQGVEYRVPEWLGPRTRGVSLEPTLLSFFTPRYLSFPAFFISWDQVIIFFFPILDLWSILLPLICCCSGCLFNYFSKMWLFTMHRFCAAVGRGVGEHRRKKPWSVTGGEWRSLRSQVSSQIRQGKKKN